MMAPRKATTSNPQQLPYFYDALMAARFLLGWKFIHDSPDGLTAGYIVETEAYMAGDAASHTFRGESARNKIMFGPPGFLYVYFTYGMHYCVNIVTGDAGSGQAVLVRALQPVEGLELMRIRRGKTDVLKLASGPAKLAQAMDIHKIHNGAPLRGNGEFSLAPGIIPEHITTTTRIGITKAVNEPWRFYITDNPYISRR